MRFEGIHHVTCITGNAPGNVDFYTRVLGLRLVKKTVNQDDPTVYHLFYADEEGSPGADITFFEYPGARRGRAGAGVVHTITFRLGSPEALAFWEARLAGEGIATRRDGERLRFEDPEGLGLELAFVATDDAPWSPGTPRSLPSTRCRGSTAFVPSPPIRPQAASCSSRCSGSSRPARPPGRRGARSGAARMPSTLRRRRAPACPAQAPFTMSRSRRTWTSRTRGSTPFAPPAATRAA